MERFLSVGFADSLGSRQQVALGGEERRKVAGGNAQPHGSRGQPSGVGVKEVQHECSRRPESVVAPPHSEAIGGPIAVAGAGSDGRAPVGVQALSDYRRDARLGRVRHLATPAGDVHPQAFHGQSLVLMLAARFVAMGGDAGWAVVQPHSRRGLVSVLPAGSGGLVKVHVALGQQVGIFAE